MEDPLDDHLSTVSPRTMQKPRLLLNHIREAYPIGIPPLSVKSTTDRIGLDAGYSFHLGTPEPELRRIASWILTNINDVEIIEAIIGRLWKRFGREDLVLSSILLANLPDDNKMKNWKWITLIELVSHIEKKKMRIPVEVILLHVEEMVRANCAKIEENLALKLLNGTKAENCLGIVGIYHLAKSDSIDDSIKVALDSVVLPDGDGLLRRIRDAILN